MSRIDEIKARLESATPGEPGKYLPELEPRRMAAISPSNEDFEFNVFDEFTLEEQDADLIAHAPADIALLLELVAKYELALSNISYMETIYPITEAIDMASETLAVAAKLKEGK